MTDQAQSTEQLSANGIQQMIASAPAITARVEEIDLEALEIAA